MGSPTDDQGAAALLNELRRALSFLDAARKATDDQARARDVEDALKAYGEAAQTLSKGVSYSEEEWLQIEELASEFRVRLPSIQ
jgi:hypothetical protein